MIRILLKYQQKKNGFHYLDQKIRENVNTLLIDETELPNISNIITGHRTKAAKLRTEKSLEAKGESAINTTDKDSRA